MNRSGVGDPCYSRRKAGRLTRLPLELARPRTQPRSFRTAPRHVQDRISRRSEWFSRCLYRRTLVRLPEGRDRSQCGSPGQCSYYRNRRESIEKACRRADGDTHLITPRVRPWKLPSTLKTIAFPSGTPFFSYAHLRESFRAVSTASAPVFMGRTISNPSNDVTFFAYCPKTEL